MPRPISSGAWPPASAISSARYSTGTCSVLAGALQRRLVQVELLEAARAHDHESVDVVLLQVEQLAARELQRRRALADAVQRAAAALHLGRVVHDGGAHGGHETLHLGRRHGVVPAHRRLGAQQVTAVVHRQAQAAELRTVRLGHEAGADVVGQPLGEMPHAQVAVVLQVLGAQQVVDLVVLAPVRREVALRLAERGVAAVARRHQIETGALHERQVARRGGVERPRPVRLDERAFGQHV